MHCSDWGGEQMDNNKGTRRFATVVLKVAVVLTLLPLVLLTVASISSDKAILVDGYKFIPSAISFDSYRYMVMQGAMIARSYGISLLVTLIGTVSGVLLTAMLAYPMSRKDFKYRNILAFFVFFTMLFNGGIVASYIMWSRVFKIKNTLFALILPNYLVTAMNVFIVRNYYTNNVPAAVIESAQIDGASEFRIFWGIMLPLSTPAIVTVALFTGLAYWNDWVNGLYFITDSNMYGIQNLLIRIMNNIQALKSSATSMMGAANIELPSFSVRMAMAIIGMLPILVIYPFAQKYLMRGIVMGAVKE